MMTRLEVNYAVSEKGVGCDVDRDDRGDTAYRATGFTGQWAAQGCTVGYIGLQWTVLGCIRLQWTVLGYIGLK